MSLDFPLERRSQAVFFLLLTNAYCENNNSRGYCKKHQREFVRSSVAFVMMHAVWIFIQ